MFREFMFYGHMISSRYSYALLAPFAKQLKLDAMFTAKLVLYKVLFLQITFTGVAPNTVLCQ